VEHLGRDWRPAWAGLVQAVRRGRAPAPACGLVALFESNPLDAAELAVAVLLGHSGAAGPQVLAESIERSIAVACSGRETGPSPPAPLRTAGLLEELIIGQSPTIRRVLEQVQLVAAKDTTVLITGETGTGKERVSRAIHLLSQRGRRDMVSVNCGGIPATLLEDEFFGHVKGAFTDARQARLGRFEQAHGSTIFLDEIGDLPLELQPKLLRVLQEREIHRIGGVEAIQLDVRVIAATNVNLWRRVEDGRFREDLFYRINVFPIHLPPLRERREDIPLFLRRFITRLCQRDKLPPKLLDPGAEDTLCRRPWRGNIRELENACEFAVIRSYDREVILLDDFPASRDSENGAGVLPPDGTLARGQAIDFNAVIGRVEKDLVLRALEAAQGNKNRAAQLLGLKRTTLIEKLKRLDKS
jgi:transcriptional regulator with GAF, ATPase, and Fis domain